MKKTWIIRLPTPEDIKISEEEYIRFMQWLTVAPVGKVVYLCPLVDVEGVVHIVQIAQIIEIVKDYYEES